jgi:NitT/TauT family transport system ATP-binding protein
VGVAADALRRGFNGRFDFGQGNRSVPNFNVFHDRNANEPTIAKAGWVIEQLRARNLCPTTQLTFALGRQVFRSDIFERAVRLRSSVPTHHENETQSEKILV